MAAIVFALASSALWGLADYLGGLKSRTFPVPVVLALMYGASLTVMLVFVAARGGGPPSSSHVLASLGSGGVGIAGLSAFYLALAVVGIVLASREDDAGAVDADQQRLSIVLAVVAGLGFGSYFVLAEIGS